MEDSYRNRQQEQILTKYQRSLEEICHPRNQDVYIEVETRIGTIINHEKDYFQSGIKRE